jgi:hypothetical protein
MSSLLKTGPWLIFVLPFVICGTVHNVPDSFLTIQSAIDASNEGDTVLVDTGEYYEGIDFNGKRIVVGSTFILDQDTTWISKTIIRDSLPKFDTVDGELFMINEPRNQIVFDSSENSNSVMSGFTILNEAIIISGRSNPSFTSNCIEATFISDTVPNLTSRMMVMTSSSYPITGLVFKNSRLEVDYSISAIVSKNIFVNSSAFLDRSSSHRIIEHNRLEHSSLACMISNDTVEIIQNSFFCSTVSSGGTGYDSQFISVSNNTFTCDSSWRSQLVFGGTGNVCIRGLIDKNRFYNSILSFEGTGLTNHQFEIEDNVFTSESTSNAGYLSFDGTGLCSIKATIRNNQFIGVPVYLTGTGDYHSQIELSNNSICQSRNDGIIIQPIASAFHKCLVNKNTITGNKIGIVNRSTSQQAPQIHIVNTILWNNDTDLVGINPNEISYSLFSTGLDTTENAIVKVNPEFYNEVEHDFHLKSGSPCINTGDPASSPDADGSRADLGAFPYEIAATNNFFEKFQITTPPVCRIVNNTLFVSFEDFPDKDRAIPIEIFDINGKMLHKAKMLPSQGNLFQMSTNRISDSVIPLLIKCGQLKPVAVYPLE